MQRFLLNHVGGFLAGIVKNRKRENCDGTQCLTQGTIGWPSACRGILTCILCTSQVFQIVLLLCNIVYNHSLLSVLFHLHALTDSIYNHLFLT